MDYKGDMDEKEEPKVDLRQVSGVGRGKLYVQARELLDSLSLKEVSIEDYARFNSLLVMWRNKKPEEWALFGERVRKMPAAERRYQKLKRATEFMEFRKSGLRDAENTARAQIRAANIMRTQAERQERAEVERTIAQAEVERVEKERGILALNILNFPQALKKGSPLGHDGRLDAQEIAHLRALGYDVQHYKQAIGPRQVELYLQGCILGTIEYDDMKFKAVESMRKHYMRISKEEAESELKRTKRDDPVRLLAKWGSEIGKEKWDGQNVTLTMYKRRLNKQQAEELRVKKLSEALDRAVDDKIYDPQGELDEKMSAAVQAAKELVKEEIKKEKVVIISASELVKNLKDKPKEQPDG